MDPFASFFGDFGFFDDGHHRGGRETPRGADVVIDLWVTLEELYSGNFVEVRDDKVVSMLRAKLEIRLIASFCRSICLDLVMVFRNLSIFYVTYGIGSR